MSTQLDQIRRSDSADHGAPAAQATGMDWQDAGRDWRSLEKPMFTFEKILALAFIAFVVTSIVIMTMPPLISDDIEIIYFRVGKAAPVDQPAYITPESIRKPGDQSSAHDDRSDRSMFIPPDGAGTHAAGDALFANGVSPDGSAGACSPRTETLACRLWVPRKETSHEI